MDARSFVATCEAAADRQHLQAVHRLYARFAAAEVQWMADVGHAQMMRDIYGDHGESAHGLVAGDARLDGPGDQGADCKGFARVADSEALTLTMFGLPVRVTDRIQ
jgi:hypothetical protein